MLLRIDTGKASAADPPFRSASRSPSPLVDTIQDDEKWRKGDFGLVSSNGVRFRVDSIKLMAAG